MSGGTLAVSLKKPLRRLRIRDERVAPARLGVGRPVETAHRLQSLFEVTVIRSRALNEFMDEQIYGPYHLWIHIHRFDDDGGQGTGIEDTMRYGLSLGPFGEMAYPLVRLQLGRIFQYRQSAVRSCLLGSSG